MKTLTLTASTVYIKLQKQLQSNNNCVLSTNQFIYKVIFQVIPEVIFLINHTRAKPCTES